MVRIDLDERHHFRIKKIQVGPAPADVRHEKYVIGSERPD